MSIALISASWHADLLDGGRASCESVLAAAGHESVCFRVPGALEIPMLAMQLAKSGRHRAVIAFGLIVDGGIYRHEFVSSTVIDGLMRVQLDTGVPVFSCVLTPQRFDEGPERLAFFRDHLVVKGREVGNACLTMLDVLGRVAGPV